MQQSLWLMIVGRNKANAYNGMSLPEYISMPTQAFQSAKLDLMYFHLRLSPPALN